MQYPDPDWFTDNYLLSLYGLLDVLGAEEEKKILQVEFSRSADILEDLQVEHTRLFINGVPHVAAPPYGSVYLEKTLRGPYSDKILTYYRSLGYNLTENADLPDSLIHQLEFLSFLAEDNNRENEEEFLARFFLPWFSIFASKVKEEAQHPFYRTIVSFIDFFTKEELEDGVQHNEA
jgi:TorA maturation chaperone TorD